MIHSITPSKQFAVLTTKYMDLNHYFHHGISANKKHAINYVLQNNFQCLFHNHAPLDTFKLCWPVSHLSLTQVFLVFLYLYFVNVLSCRHTSNVSANTHLNVTHFRWAFSNSIDSVESFSFIVRLTILVEVSK